MTVRRQASSAAFVGRREELSRLEALLDSARAGSAATALIAGDAGIGKTRIVDELTQRATALGAHVLSGGCIDLGNDVLPYAPFVEILSDLMRAEGVAVVHELAGPTAAELSRLVPALAPGRDIPEFSRASSTRMYVALSSVFQGLARRRTLVLVVEDVHWADQSTRELLALLARTLRGRVLMLMTARTDEVSGGDGWRRLAAELARSRAHRLDLQPLSRADQARQISGILGMPPSAALLDEIFQRADGNPFFAEELLALGATDQLPATVRDLLLARVTALPDDTQRVLRIAAAAGPLVGHGFLRTVADCGATDLEDALRPAVTGHVLVPQSKAHAYEFRHALLHETVNSTLLPAEAARLHRRLAEALTADRSAAGVAEAGTAARIAHHWHAAGDDRQTFTASYEAAEEAAEALAFNEALAHYERCIALLDRVEAADSLLPGPRYQLFWDAAETAHLSGRAPRAAELIRSAIDTVDSSHPYHRAYLHERLGRYLWMDADGEDALPAYERAVALAPEEPPSCWRAAIVSGYAQMLMLAGRVSEAKPRCEEAIRITEQIPNGRSTQGHARNTLGVVLATLGDLSAGVEQLRVARTIAEEEFDDVDDIGRAIVNLSSILLDAGRYGDAAAHAIDGIAVIDGLGLQRRKGVWCRCDAAEALVALGRWEEAQELLDEATALEPDGIDLERVLETRGELALRQGDLGQAAKDLCDAHMRAARVVDGQINGPLYTALTELACWQGDHDRALAYAEEGSSRLLEDEDATFCVPLYAAAARAAADAGASPEGWVAAAQAAVDRDAARKKPARAFMLIALAEAARYTGAESWQLWRDAASAWSEIGDPWRLAYCRWREAEAALTQRLPRQSAMTAATEAIDLAASVGATGLADEVQALARRARLRLGRTPGRRAGERPFHLTHRESEILELVAEGRTDRQIGDELFISHRTVERHVSNILGKVGATTRAEATAIAHRSGLVRS